MKMKKMLILALSAILAVTAVILAGCGGEVKYSDGTYTGRSSVYEGDEDGSGAGYGEITITISGGVITDSVFLTYEPDGTLKDEDYGKQDGEVANRDFYNKAQRAVLASTKYGETLSEKGDASEVDVISGATISYGEFKEAVADALSKARQN